MTDIKRRTVLITGGASGIGAAVGEHVLRAGAGHLAVWDIDEPTLTAKVNALGARGRHVDGFRVDVADLSQVQAALREMSARSIEVDVLINNAGIVVARQFVDHTHDDIDRTMRINAMAPMHVARELLPGMLQRGRGHVVNIASAAGLLATPRMSAYCASKWAMIGWSESLRLELERSGSPVRVTTVMPYYTDTGMFAGVRSPVIPILNPESVAAAIVSAIESNKIVLRLPWIVNALPSVRGLLPARWFDKVVGDWMGVYESMKTFKGR